MTESFSLEQEFIRLALRPPNFAQPHFQSKQLMTRGGVKEDRGAKNQTKGARVKKTTKVSVLYSEPNDNRKAKKTSSLNRVADNKIELVNDAAMQEASTSPPPRVMVPSVLSCVTNHRLQPLNLTLVPSNPTKHPPHPPLAPHKAVSTSKPTSGPQFRVPSTLSSLPPPSAAPFAPPAPSPLTIDLVSADASEDELSDVADEAELSDIADEDELSDIADEACSRGPEEDGRRYHNSPPSSPPTELEPLPISSSPSLLLISSSSLPFSQGEAGFQQELDMHHEVWSEEVGEAQVNESSPILVEPLLPGISINRESEGGNGIGEEQEGGRQGGRSVSGPSPSEESPAPSSSSGRVGRVEGEEDGLGSSECQMEFWSTPGTPEVYEVFPFQKEALEFANWCNSCAADDLRRMAEGGRVNFDSFKSRWKFISEWMRTHPCPQPQPEGPSTTFEPLRPLEPYRVFTEEYPGKASRDPGGGFTRHFVVTTYKGVWKKYQQLPLLRRHWYEVIREDRPCHMYFDVEFSRGSNPGLNGDLLMELIVSLVKRMFREEFGVQVDDSCFIDLESQTLAIPEPSGAHGHDAAPQLILADKFSRHLVVRAPGCAFSSSRVVAACISLVRQYPEASALWAFKEGDTSSKVSIIDMAVYSRMRHFRMVWSCKGGKKAVLQPLPRYAFRQLQGTDRTLLSPTRVFLLSAICNVHPCAKLLVMKSRVALEGADASTAGCLGLGFPGLASIRSESTVQHPITGQSIKVSWIYSQDPVLQQFRKTLYRVAWDALPFVECIATSRAMGMEAQVRSVAYCGDGGTVTYGLVGPGSHHCLRIGRSHRSNHVYLLLDFGTGGVCQKCYDPECSGYRSEWQPLPHSVWRSEQLAPLLREAHLKQTPVPPLLLEDGGRVQMNTNPQTS